MRRSGTARQPGAASLRDIAITRGGRLAGRTAAREAVHPRRLEAYIQTLDAIWRATPAGLSTLEGCERPSFLARSPDGTSLAAVCGPPGAAEIALVDTSQWAITRRIPSVTGYVGPLVVTGGQRVIDCLADHLVFGEPVGSHPVQPRDPLGIAAVPVLPEAAA